jgi:hypothetical protein
MDKSEGGGSQCVATNKVIGFGIQMRKLFILLIVTMALPSLGAAPDFDVGQVWAYKTRPGEQDSTLLINKVEEDPKLGRIYHISVSKVQIKVGAAIFTHELPHLPVSLKTLKLSCTELVGHSEPNPMYLPGYRMWREAFDAGHAGIYTVSVSEIVDLSEKMLQKVPTTTSGATLTELR